MRKKIVWLVVSCLMVAALVLASCGPAVTEEEEEVAPPVKEKEVAPPPVEEEVIPAKEGPEYGGVMRVAANADTLGFDDIFVPAQTFAYSIHFTHERPFMGDWTKGPAGTDETRWWGPSYNLEYETGCLAEDWEVPDPDTVIFYIRKGIHFHDVPPVNGRELVAEDVAHSITRNFNLQGYVKMTYSGWFESATATDKYTVVIKGKDSEAQRTAAVFEMLTDWIFVMPPELYPADGAMKEWENSCGTGPFMLVDYVSDSSHTFVRNPDYWMNDPLNPDNRLPYLDGIKIKIIPDVSTRLAALRTGKVDILYTLAWEDAQYLIKNNPELEYAKVLRGYADRVHLRMDDPELPWHDIRVRHALALALDNQEIADEFYGGDAEINAYPIAPVKEYMHMYTPLDELPESVRELYEYHPDKARQLLAEAGYPDGFKSTIICYTPQVDAISIIKAYWADIGVDIELEVKEYAVWQSVATRKTYTGMLYHYSVTGPPYKCIDVKPGVMLNKSIIDDPYINERYAGVWSWENMGNRTERSRLMKEIALRQHEQQWSIAFPTPYFYQVWKPWLKNCYGVSDVGYYNPWAVSRFVWIDQDLKE